MPILKKQPAAAPAKEDKKPAPSAGSAKNPVKGPAKDAFAQKLAETEASSGGTWTPPPVGTYSCLVTEAQGVIDGDKTCAFFEVTIVDHEEQAGKTARIYFNFTDENGDEQGGMPYFKSAMAMFGVDCDKEIDSWDTMCGFLAEIAKQNMWCHISVKRKGKNTNIYIDDVPDDQDSKPSLPE